MPAGEMILSRNREKLSKSLPTEVAMAESENSEKFTILCHFGRRSAITGSLEDAGASVSRTEVRLGALDGLRAMAIALVLVCHATYYIYSRPGHNFSATGTGRHIRYFLLNGWTGVDLFFVLSGFLITRQLLLFDVQQAWIPFVGQYLKRRFFRIVPAYYMVLTLISAGILVQQWPPRPAEFQAWAWAFSDHLFFMHRYFGDATPDLVFWSLVTEARFYALAPLIVLALLQLRSRARCLILVGTVAVMCVINSLIALSNPPLTPSEYFSTLIVPFHNSLLCPLAGMLCSFIWSDEALRRSIGWRPISEVMFAAGILLYCWLSAGIVPYGDWSYHGLNWFSETVYFPLIAVAFSLILLGLLGGCSCRRFFECRPLRGLALISYSVYLIHNIFAERVSALAERWMGTGGNTSLLWLITLTLILAYTIPLAVLSYFIVEKPFIDWAHRRS